MRGPYPRSVSRTRLWQFWGLMSDDDLDEAAEYIRILVRRELETGRWLEGHPASDADCPVCEAHRSAGGPAVPWDPDRG